MKKILILIVIVALGIGLFSWLHKSEEPKADPTTTTVGAGFHPDPSHATFTFDGEEVTLSAGHGSSQDESIGLTTETELLDHASYGDLNGDGKEDTLVLLAQSGGGSGTFIYAAAFVSGPVGYKGTNAVFLGDRIEPQATSIKDTIATVKYLDRKPDEPFTAEPTVSTSKELIYKNSELQEK